jgi:predicted aldo/keto reductase-like oxidoreductase
MSDHSMSAPIKTVESGLIDVLMVPISLSQLIADLIHRGDNSGERSSGELYQACAKQDVGLVAMKPYWGGNLFSHQGKPSGLTATHCLAYVLSHPVSTTVPGVSTVEHLQEALHYLEATDEEKEYRSIIENIPTAWQGQCVYCNHCLPCPLDINIGGICWLADESKGMGSWSFDELQPHYANLKTKASDCNECGVCLERCPFEVDIIAKMREAAEIFEAKAG